MKIVIGLIMHESNNFSPLLTQTADFQKEHLLFGEEILEYHHGKKTEIDGILDIINDNGFEAIPTLSAFALTGGPLTEEVFEFLLEKLMQPVRNSKKIDGVMLALHGAMRTKLIDDLEGIILEKLRKFLGSDIPIGITLDHHANVTKKMIDNVDFAISYRTHPHIDQFQIGRKMAEVIVDILKHKLNPITKMIQIPMILPGESSSEARLHLTNEINDLERNNKIISASFNIGYTLANSKNTGPSVVVITNDDEALAIEKCRNFAGLMWSLRDDFSIQMPTVDEVIQYVYKSIGGPFVLCDLGDCMFAGGTGDVNKFLDALLKEKIGKAALSLVDAEAVKECVEVGEGNLITIKVGGKIDRINSKPFLITGKIVKITDHDYIGAGANMVKMILKRGKTAVLKVNGVDMVLTEKRCAMHDPNFFRSIDIKPEDKKVLVIKDAYYTTLTYSKIAKEVIFVDSPGVCMIDYDKNKFNQISRPVYPFDKITFNKNEYLN